MQRADAAPVVESPKAFSMKSVLHAITPPIIVDAYKSLPDNAQVWSAAAHGPFPCGTPAL
jgi:hypothetical protein